MVLKIFFTPEEISSFFRENGYKVEQRTFGRWDKRSHGDMKWVEYTDDAVVISNQQVKASDLFQLMAEFRLKRVCTPVNNETKRAIENTFKTMLK